MKKLFFVILLFVGSSSPALATEWYEGGNLHNSTIPEWYKATVQNRLATSADIVAGTSDQELLVKAGMAKWKTAAVAIMECINNATENYPGNLTQNVANFGSMCVVLHKKQYPFLGTKED